MYEFWGSWQIWLQSRSLSTRTTLPCVCDIYVFVTYVWVLRFVTDMTTIAQLVDADYTTMRLWHICVCDICMSFEVRDRYDYNRKCRVTQGVHFAVNSLQYNIQDLRLMHGTIRLINKLTYMSSWRKWVWHIWVRDVNEFVNEVNSAVTNSYMCNSLQYNIQDFHLMHGTIRLINKLIYVTNSYMSRISMNLTTSYIRHELICLWGYSFLCRKLICFSRTAQEEKGISDLQKCHELDSCRELISLSRTHIFVTNSYICHEVRRRRRAFPWLLNGGPTAANSGPM